MLFFLIGLAFAQDEPEAIDWTEYDEMARTTCRAVKTTQDYGALAAAQIVLVGHAQVAVLGSQMKLAELQLTGRSPSASATIESARVALGAQGELLTEWAGFLALEAYASPGSETPRTLSRRVLRRRCLSSFVGTRNHAQETIDLLFAQGEAISLISLGEISARSRETD